MTGQPAAALAVIRAAAASHPSAAPEQLTDRIAAELTACGWRIVPDLITEESTP